MQPRKLLRIAWWEVSKNAGGIDRRTIAVAVAAIALLGLVAPIIAGGSPGLDEGLYQVGADEDSQYYDVVRSDDTFVVVDDPGENALRQGGIDLRIDGPTVGRAPTEKGNAALAELRSSVKSYNNRQLRQERNETAAFPIAVVLDYRERAEIGTTLATGTGDDDGTGSDASGDGTAGSGDGTGADVDEPGDAGADSDGTGDTGDGTDDAGGAGQGAGDDSDETVDPGGGGGLGGLTGPLSDDTVSSSPSDISPPFPFQSLVLAFVFVIPLNFLIQAYGSTILSERTNRRGELLLVSPVSRYDIIGGKTLPYFLGAMLVEAAIATGMFYLLQGEVGGLLSVIAVAPLVLLFLGATFLGAMFARSFKELTFVTVTITVSLTSYAFVPAIFADVGEIALISPLTLVVRDLQNEAVSIAGFAFSTVPPFLAALTLFGLGAGLYREEDMFAQRSIPGRVIDALGGPISRPRHVGAMTAALIPFVFVTQLLAIAVLFVVGSAFGVGVSVVLVLVVVAVVEEVAKSIHVYAAYQHRRFDATARTALVLGAASGAGFFLAEKIALLAQLVGLPELAVAEAGLVGGVVAGPLVLVFLLAPLLLHVVTAAISAVGASRGKRAYVAAVALAMVVHFAYNLLVVMTVV